MKPNSEYPRSLTLREKNRIEWLLPSERKGYRQFREILRGLLVIGQGRRGKGNIVLGQKGDAPDLISPLPPIFAYGVIEAEGLSVSVLLREEAGRQVEVEIVPLKGESIPEKLVEKRRWTYSTWMPGESCPCCNEKTREVPIGEPAVEAVISVCSVDRRIWVYEMASEVNHLIPITNFYNELMLHKHIRDSHIVLDTSHFFSNLSEFSDPEISHSFIVYNKIRKKVDLATVPQETSRPRKSFRKLLKKILST